LAIGCPLPNDDDDDDDDDAACEGTLDATFNGDPFSGSAGKVCTSRQGTAFIVIDANDDALDADWHIYFAAFEGPGTFEIAEYTNYTMTGHLGAQSFVATSGTVIVDSWSDPDLSGSFDVEGVSTDSTTAMTCSGTFDVVVVDYVE
jgi:hypothetical protein